MNIIIQNILDKSDKLFDKRKTMLFVRIQTVISFIFIDSDYMNSRTHLIAGSKFTLSTIMAH